MIFRKYRQIHFIGIGGIGMSAIAEILLKHGFVVSGSDLQRTEVTDRLSTLGAAVFKGHSPNHLGSAEVAVYSSAVRGDNTELREARRLNIPVIRRAEMLAELMRMKFGVAVAGTHGKTTTTSMVGAILAEAGLDPTVIVGGISPVFGSNARIGGGQYLVVEADEFDRSFLKLTPTIAVITSLEMEHLDCYSDLDDLMKAFSVFGNSVPFYGTVILCLDDPTVRELRAMLDRPVLTYGVDAEAEIRAVDIAVKENTTEYRLWVRGEDMGRVELHVPGIHNVENSLAAVAVALELDIPCEKVIGAFGNFIGVERRFEIKCCVNNIIVVDDYAHHFTEIEATLEAAKAGYDRRVIAVFQPHLFSRTRDFHRQFGGAFNNADVLFVAPIYPAREEPIAGVSGKIIADAAREAGHPAAHYIEERAALVEAVLKEVRPGDMIITMGAGDIWREGLELCRRIRASADEF